MSPCRFCRPVETRPTTTEATTTAETTTTAEQRGEATASARSFCAACHPNGPATSSGRSSVSGTMGSFFPGAAAAAGRVGAAAAAGRVGAAAAAGRVGAAAAGAAAAAGRVGAAAAAGRVGAAAAVQAAENSRALATRERPSILPDGPNGHSSTHSCCPAKNHRSRWSPSHLEMHDPRKNGSRWSPSHLEMHDPRSRSQGCRGTEDTDCGEIPDELVHLLPMVQEATDVSCEDRQ
jgi:hypothetical protein